jgi:hypothetical protein
MAKEIINRVQRSGIQTIDIEETYPSNPRSVVDIAPWLWEGIALKEKDFRASVANHDWSQYQDHFVAVTCSEDAIIPTWAYMLISSALAPYASLISVGSTETLESIVFRNWVDQNIIAEEYTDHRIVIKGCSKHPVPTDAYAYLTQQLQPFAKNIMFGEPCSTVPIYKKKRY